MSNTIKDGTGNGNLAKVDGNNRFHTGSVVRAERDAAMNDDRLFILSTQKLTLTNDSVTPLIYIKNNDDNPLRIDEVRFYTGPTTDGSGSYYITSWANIDNSSTIVSEAKVMPAFSATASNKAFNVVAYIGETDDTIVNGINVVTVIRQPTDREVFEPRATLPKGSSVTFALEPPTGNTSMEVSVIISAYFVDPELPS